MGARYLVELADVLRAAGVAVVEVDGWQTRARSSGGFESGYPACTTWHHTATTTTAANDAAYCATGAADAPLANVLVDRAGVAWVLAAGATNTSGKGGPVVVPPGVTVPLDGMNSRSVGMELANSGVGERYPAEQVDAAFAVSLAVAQLAGIPPDAVVTHQHWAPTRKIDPATGLAVEGGWAPGTVTASGTWSLDDLRAELVRRSSCSPLPTEDDVPKPLIVEHRNALWVVAADLSSRVHLVAQADVDALMATGQYLALGAALSDEQLEAVPVAS